MNNNLPTHWSASRPEHFKCVLTQSALSHINAELEDALIGHWGHKSESTWLVKSMPTLIKTAIEKACLSAVNKQDWTLELRTKEMLAGVLGLPILHPVEESAQSVADMLAMHLVDAIHRYDIKVLAVPKYRTFSHVWSPKLILTTLGYPNRKSDRPGAPVKVTRTFGYITSDKETDKFYAALNQYCNYYYGPTPSVWGRVGNFIPKEQIEYLKKMPGYE